QPLAHLAVRDRRHDGEQDRRAVPGRAERAALRVAVLPGVHPAGDRPGLHPARPADLAALQRRTGGLAMSVAELDPTAPLTPTGNLRRRLIVSRIAVSGATGAALAAAGVRGIAGDAVFKRGARRRS